MVISGFFVLLVVHIRPIWKFRDGIIGGEMGDGLMNAFHIWWMKQVFTQGFWPWETPYLYHPVGADMYWHTLAPIKASFGALLLPFFDPITAYNVLLFLTFIAVGYTTWLFLRYMVARTSGPGRYDDVVAFAGSCVFLLSGYVLINVVRHINLLSVEGVPLFLLWYFKYKDSGKGRYLGFMALTTLYISLCEYYYLVYIGLFMAVDMAFAVYASGNTFLSSSFWKKSDVRMIFSSIGASLAGAAPMLLILAFHAFPPPINTNHLGSDYPLEPLGLVLPGFNSYWFTFLPEAIKSFFVTGRDSVSTFGFFMGIATPCIAAYAVWKNVGQSRHFALIGAAFLILSLGPYLTIARSTLLSVSTLGIVACIVMLPFLRRHRLVRDLFAVALACIIVDLLVGFALYGKPLHLMIPLPYILFQNLVPFFSRGGMPCRFVVMAYLMLATCFSISVTELVKKRFMGLMAIELLIVAILIPNIEFARDQIDFITVYPTLTSDIVERIRAEPKDVAVFGDTSIFTEFEVTQHEHPVSFGRLSRTSVKNMNQHQDILQRFLWVAKTPVPTEAEKAELLATVRRDAFKYVIMHSFIPSRDEFIRSVLGGTLLYRTGGVQVYQMYE